MNIFASLYIVADGFFVANFVGKPEFAAVTLIMPVLNILGTIGYMFGVGGSALVAKTLGEGDRERANRLFTMIVTVSFCVGFLLMVLGFIFMPRIALLLGAEGMLFEHSVLYWRIIILALPTWILVYEFQLFFVTAEKPNLGLAVTVFAGLCNVALDALFPDAVHSFRIFSFSYLFTGMAVFCSSFFTALNNGRVSALISFLRTFVFELGAVLALPLVMGVDGIWSAVVFAELTAAVTGAVFMVALKKKYHY